MKISNNFWIVLGILSVLFLTSFQSSNSMASANKQTYLEFKQVNKEMIYVNVENITYITPEGKNTRLSFLNGSFTEIELSYAKTVDAVRKLQVK